MEVPHVDWSNLDEVLIELVFLLVSSCCLTSLSNTALVLAPVSVKEFLKDASSHQVKDRNEISRVVFELPVQLIVKLPEMLTIDLQYVLFGLLNLSQLLNVGRLLLIVDLLIP